jgi:hypothetical protein
MNSVTPNGRIALIIGVGLLLDDAIRKLLFVPTLSGR